jgi:uncharacterized protein involved in exopolysaccharide biosynthesis
MNDTISGDVTPGTDRVNAPGDRIICVVGRDVLSLDRHDADFSGFFAAVWRGRWLVLGFILGFGALAAAYSLLATEWYVAETVLTPAASKGINGLASQLGSVSALAGLAGINIGEEKSTEPLGVLESRDFARQFIEDQQLLHVFLWKDWDAQTGRWKQSDPRDQPDIRDAIRYFDKHVLMVQEDRKTGLITLGIRWKEPAAAAAWANMLVDRLNEQMRSRALLQAETNVEYLQKELTATTQIAVQQAVSRLIESELQKVMVARGNKEFAFRVIDHAEVPKLRSWPQRGVIVALGVLAGGLAGLIAVFIRQSFHGKPATTPHRA